MMRARRSRASEVQGSEVWAHIRGDKYFREQYMKIASAANAEGTAATYRRHVKRVGGHDPVSFAKFVMREMEKPRKSEGDAGKKHRAATSYVRSLKSGCVYVAFEENRPWDPRDDQMINTLIQGYEGANDSPAVRGALSDEMMEQLVQKAEVRARKDSRWKDVQEGLEVLWACCARGRDIAELTMSRVDRRRGSFGTLIWVEMKLAKNVKVRLGSFEPKAIASPDAVEILKRRVTEIAAREDMKVYASDDPAKGGKAARLRIFPGYTAKRVSEIVRECAEQYDWPEDVMYTGHHNVRHGRAAKAFVDGMEAVRAQGRWRGSDGPRRYGFRNTSGRPNVEEEAEAGSHFRLESKVMRSKIGQDAHRGSGKKGNAAARETKGTATKAERMIESWSKFAKKSR